MQEDGVQRGDVFVHRDEGRKKRIRALCPGEALVPQQRREAQLIQIEQLAERGLNGTPLKHFQAFSTLKLLKLRQTSRSQQALARSASQVLQYLCFHFLARNKTSDRVFEEGSFIRVHKSSWRSEESLGCPPLPHVPLTEGGGGGVEREEIQCQIKLKSLCSTAVTTALGAVNNTDSLGRTMVLMG